MKQTANTNPIDPLTGTPKLGRPRRISPNAWKYGSDPIVHKIHNMHSNFHQQCRNRKEQDEITFNDFLELWLTDDRYLKRGRQSNCLNMVRIDISKPWHKDNVEFLERSKAYAIRLERKAQMEKANEEATNGETEET